MRRSPLRVSSTAAAAPAAGSDADPSIGRSLRSVRSVAIRAFNAARVKKVSFRSRARIQRSATCTATSTFALSKAVNCGRANAPHQIFRVTHPFHPPTGRTFEVVSVHQTWGEYPGLLHR